MCASKRDKRKEAHLRFQCRRHEVFIATNAHSDFPEPIDGRHIALLTELGKFPGAMVSINIEPLRG